MVRNDSPDGLQLLIDIPTPDSGLFRSETLNDVITYLGRQYNYEFSITELADEIGRSRASVTTAIDILVKNNLVEERREAGKRLVKINRGRLNVPADPIFEIPQSEFHQPVKEAWNSLAEELTDVLGIVVYGSVARGEADRRSDIDLWVLVESDRMENQQRANQVRESLEAQEFDQGRYAFDIDVEVLNAVPNYEDDIREILREGIAIYLTEEFQQVQSMLLKGEENE